MRGRAYRRFQEEKHKRRARFLFREVFWGHEDIDDRMAGIRAGTRCPCSCMMCGNPRKWLGERTVQERREDVSIACYCDDDT